MRPTSTNACTSACNTRRTSDSKYAFTSGNATTGASTISAGTCSRCFRARYFTSSSRKTASGLYGVDLKQTDRGLYVIEINDNPNIDAGVEDKVLEDELYRIILLEFAARLDRKRQA